MGLMFAWCRDCAESTSRVCYTHKDVGPHGQPAKVEENKP